MRSKMTRRELLSYLAVGSAGVVLAACTPPEAEPAKETEVAPPQATLVKETAAPSKEPVSLRIGWWGALARNELYNTICDMYQDANPGVTLVREYAQWSDYWVRVATQASGGNLPDISASVFNTLDEYAARGVYESLDPFVQAGTIDLADWDPVVVNCGKTRGALYQVPTGICVCGLVLNKDAIERSGVELPGFELSYADFASFAKELAATLPSDKWVIGNGPLKEQGFQSWILQKGYQIANEDASDVGFPKEVVVEFHEYWQALRDEDVVMPIEEWNLPAGDMWADSHLAKGSIVTNLEDNNELKIFQGYCDDDLTLVRYFVMPDGKHRAGDFLRGSGWSLASTSANKEEAVRFISWFANDLEANKVFNMELGAIGPKQVAEALRPSLDPKDVLVLDHFNAILKDIPPKMPDPKGTSAVIDAHFRCCEAIYYGTPIDDAVDTFLVEAKETYKNVS